MIWSSNLFREADTACHFVFAMSLFNKDMKDHDSLCVQLRNIVFVDISEFVDQIS